MYVDTAKSKQNGKVYQRHLLRSSYRENGKVKHRTLANLSHCSDEEIKAIKLALRHKGDLSVLGVATKVSTTQGMRVGAVCALNAIAQRLGLSNVFGSTRQGKLALWQVMARLLEQGSRLSSVRLAESHAVCDLLGVGPFHEDHLYSNLSWLAEHQEEFEKKLFRRRYGENVPTLFLYDVTSSYLEGVQNILAALGYNRDKKRGKKQIVIGLLTGPDGFPVAVRVFEGNTQDTQTVEQQVRLLAQQFGIKKVTLVGDRGMLKGPQLELLEQTEGFSYITAISKPQIRTLLEKGVFQLDLFSEKLAEVEADSVRYILRRNPVRAKEIEQNRQEKLAQIRHKLEEQNEYLREHPKALAKVAKRKVLEKVEKYGLSRWISISYRQRKLFLEEDEETHQEEAKLDGCYVLKTDLAQQESSTELIHQRYKSLAQVERAFRCFKQGHLEIRPIFVRRDQTTRGHVFVVMLAYMLERELEQSWGTLDTTVAEGLDELGSLRSVEIEIGGTQLHQIPAATGLAKQLLDNAQINLPQILPRRKWHVATRKSIAKTEK